MGLIDGLLGNASKIEPAKIQEEFGRILAPGEKVEHACPFPASQSAGLEQSVQRLPQLLEMLVAWGRAQEQDRRYVST